MDYKLVYFLIRNEHKIQTSLEILCYIKINFIKCYNIVSKINVLRYLFIFFHSNLKKKYCFIIYNNNHYRYIK